MVNTSNTVSPLLRRNAPFRKIWCCVWDPLVEFSVQSFLVCFVDSEQENVEPTPPTVETPPTAMSYYDSPPPPAAQPQPASPLSNGTTHLEEPVEPVAPPKPVVEVEPEPPAPVVEEPEPVMESIYKPPTPETVPEPEPEPAHVEPEIPKGELKNIACLIFSFNK